MVINMYEYNRNELYHHGILGQKWGVRRYQYEDGTLTPEGKKRYYNGDVRYGVLSRIETKFADKLANKVRSKKSKPGIIGETRNEIAYNIQQSSRIRGTILNKLAGKKTDKNVERYIHGQLGSLGVNTVAGAVATAGINALVDTVGSTYIKDPSAKLAVKAGASALANLGIWGATNYTRDAFEDLYDRREERRAMRGKKNE